MIINSQNLHGMYVGFNTIFNQAFSGVKPLYGRVATVTPSTTEAETYAWLGEIPGMREWIGDREVKNLSSSDYTIRNKSFELTIGIGRDAVEDDKIGLYRPSVEMLAHAAAMHPDDLIFSLLTNGWSNQCYDKKPFFSDAHRVGKGTVSNLGKAKLTPESYRAARASMASLKNGAGQPLGLMPNLLVVPPALEGVAMDILKADIILGSTNTLRGTAEPLVVPQLATADTAWYLLDVSRPIRPLIYQERRKPEFVAQVDPKDPSVFASKTFLYGVDSRGNSGYGLWQMAYGSDGSASS